jgi:hypothetical protein
VIRTGGSEEGHISKVKVDLLYICLSKPIEYVPIMDQAAGSSNSVGAAVKQGLAIMHRMATISKYSARNAKTLRILMCASPSAITIRLYPTYLRPLPPTFDLRQDVLHKQTGWAVTPSLCCYYSENVVLKVGS